MKSNKFLSNFTKIFDLILLYILIVPLKSFLYFNYPFSLTLSDGNILVIHQKGICICNYHLSEIKQNIKTFSEDEEIRTEDSLSKITTAFENGYIISIINDKIFIFNENGTLIYESNNIILESGETAGYYTLVPIKKESSYYQYVIGYIHSKSLYLLYYKYDFTTGTNNSPTSIRSQKFYDPDSSIIPRDTYNYENKVLTCQYMTESRYNNLLVCFF